MVIFQPAMIAYLRVLTQQLSGALGEVVCKVLNHIQPLALNSTNTSQPKPGMQHGFDVTSACYDDRTASWVHCSFPCSHCITLLGFPDTVELHKFSSVGILLRFLQLNMPYEPYHLNWAKLIRHIPSICSTKLLKVLQSPWYPAATKGLVRACKHKVWAVGCDHIMSLLYLCALTVADSIPQHYLDMVSQCLPSHWYV